MRQILRKLLRRFGLDVIRYEKFDDFSKLRSRLLSHPNVEVIDVGANSGQWAKELRDSGWKGPIHSFEPISSFFQELQMNSIGDENWNVNNFALGASHEELRINISANDGGSSSFLEIQPFVTKIQENTGTISWEQTQVRRLDEVFSLDDGISRYLKADVQGFELDVLRGLGKLANSLIAIEIEVSMLELYKDQPLIEQLIGECRLLGFRPAQIRKGFENTHLKEILQIDILFVRG